MFPQAGSGQALREAEQKPSRGTYATDLCKEVLCDRKKKLDPFFWHDFEEGNGADTALVQANIDAKLPLAYLKLMGLEDGGIGDYDTLSCEGRSHDIDAFYPASEIRLTHETDASSWGCPLDVVIFSRSGHKHFYFSWDRGRDEEPSVYVGIDGDEMRVADTFDQFLSRLSLEDE